jgi:subtilisin family serine protease
MTTRSRLLQLLAGALLLSCGGGEAPGPDATRPIEPGPRSVTLLTGDRVLVYGDGRFLPEPASGRAEVVFQTFRVGEHHYVVPADAAPLVAAGQLDRRLFDVTLLVELGYDDARADLPLIVVEDGAARAASAKDLAVAGAVARPLSSIRGAAMRVPRPATAAWWSAVAGRTAGRAAAGRTARLASGVAKIWLDGKRQLFLDRSAAQIGAPAAWAAGYTGRGVTVAVLDTGIDATHPDFAGRIVETRSFLEWWPDATDDVGHGTHVASILAGSGAGEDGRYRGMAPEADLLIGKVCDEFECLESSILDGMAWAAESGAAVVNLSLGGMDTPELDPLEEAIDTLSAQHGTLFVAAAGNLGGCGGPNGLQVASPSTANAALSVGAVDAGDELASFSCRGPRVGDSAIKPDITAPGVDIVAARAPGTRAGDGDPVGEHYARLSGTSMSAPHVAGVAALVAQQHPDWRGEQIKATLMASARPAPEVSVFGQGAGRIDAERAISQTLAASPASVSLRAPSPPGPDPLVQEVALRNSGPSSLTVALELELTGPNGGPPPDGMFAVTPSQIAVPAGGEVHVSVTADATVASPDGLFTGALVATGDGAALRVPVALAKEPPSHELRVTALDRDGQPSPFDIATLVDLQTGRFIDIFLDDVGQGAERLPRGQYTLYSFQSRFDPETEALVYSALLAQPLVDLDRDLSIALDARLARPIQIQVPRSSARRASESAEFARSTARDFTGAGTIISFRNRPHSTALLYTAQLGPDLPAADLASIIGSIWAEPAPGQGQGFTDSPYQYNLAFHRFGRLPTGLSRRVQPAELATVHADYSAQAPGLTAMIQPNAESAAGGPPVGTPGATIPFHLPASRTEYFHAEGLKWRLLFMEEDGPFNTITTRLAPWVTFEAGRDYHTRWNQAVNGPSLGFPPEPDQWVTRLGDQLHFSLSLFSDRTERQGHSSLEAGASRLFRDGQLIAETDEPRDGEFDLSPGLATYRLELEATRALPSQLSSQIDLAWTFRSEHVAGDEPARLPVMTVRFAPILDEHSRAPAGRFFLIPVAISRQLDAPSAPLTRLTVDASYDRGKTWQAAPVLRLGDIGVAVVRHPARQGLVSLRATAVDRSGNAVEQTILDAYRLRK